MHFDENSFFAGDKKEANKLKVIILYFNFRYKLLGRYEYKPMFLYLTINVGIHPEIIRKITVIMFLFLKTTEVQR